MSLAVRARLRAPDAAKSVIGPGASFDRRSMSGRFMRTKAGPLRFPGDPSHTFALLRDPGRRLAGSAFAGRASNPLGHDERLSFPSSFPGLVLTLAGAIRAGASSNWRATVSRGSPGR